ncbi:MAG: hypothetical protein H6Q68_2320 [Firmicutes bacterium]|nr:hypothetical protein [Bacillota bacterium]
MSEFNLMTPVVFIIFNRPDTTQQVFEEIRKARPKKLFIIADGHRPDKPGEAESCIAVRAIVEGVDWDCEVLKNYSDVNLGCGKRVATGLDWVFNTVEEAIILEDDCIPHPTFFPFCQELLEKYRHDGRVLTISGNNFQFGHQRTDCSYYFSRYDHIWGWATWRRMWKYYDFRMKLWPEVRDSRWLFDIFGSIQVESQQGKQCFKPYGVSTIEYWHEIFEDTYAGKIDTWDYQLLFACLVQNGLHILPNTNLVSNIGFGQHATHTPGLCKFANMSVTGLEFPLKHPAFVIRDAWADEYTQVNNFS